MWGADRMDRRDSKSLQPGETPGHLAIFQKGRKYVRQQKEILQEEC